MLEEKPNQGNPPVPETPPAIPAEQPLVVPEKPVKEEKPTSPSIPDQTPSESPKEPQSFEVEGQKLTLEELQKGYMRQKDYTQKTQELAETKRKLDVINEAINPKLPEEPQTPRVVTVDELNQILADNDLRKEKEIALKTEIQTLEKEFSGTDGRPKYVDSEVLIWQKENNKMYLSPREAFEQKHKNDLLEWEVKERIRKAGQPVYQEKPGGGMEIQLPEGKNAFISKDAKGALVEDAEGRRKAILETMSNMELT